jgi:hypothetical protein
MSPNRVVTVRVPIIATSPAWEVCADVGEFPRDWLRDWLGIDVYDAAVAAGHILESRERGIG